MKRPTPFAELHPHYADSLEAVLIAAGGLVNVLQTLVTLKELPESAQDIAVDALRKYEIAWNGEGK